MIPAGLCLLQLFNSVRIVPRLLVLASRRLIRRLPGRREDGLRLFMAAEPVKARGVPHNPASYNTVCDNVIGSAHPSRVKGSPYVSARYPCLTSLPKQAGRAFLFFGWICP